MRLLAISVFAWISGLGAYLAVGKVVWNQSIIVAAPILPSWSGQRPTQDSGERGAYEAMLKVLLQGDLPSVLVVQADPVSLPVPSSADWQWFGTGIEPLRSRLQGSRPTLVEPFTVETFPPGTQLVRREEIQAFFRTAPRGGNPDDGWILFQTRYKARSIQGFSRLLTSEDGLDALLYYSHCCGSLCGESGYAWLHRASSAAAWTVLKRLPKVVS